MAECIDYCPALQIATDIISINIDHRRPSSHAVIFEVHWRGQQQTDMLMHVNVPVCRAEDCALRMEIMVFSELLMGEEFDL